MYDQYLDGKVEFGLDYIMLAQHVSVGANRQRLFRAALSVGAMARDWGRSRSLTTVEVRVFEMVTGSSCYPSLFDSRTIREQVPSKSPGRFLHPSEAGYDSDNTGYDISCQCFLLLSWVMLLLSYARDAAFVFSPGRLDQP